jgi:hypothetical protein
LDLNLPNKKPENSAPTVSKLPLPLTDSALVIDLPDGQKIVVGKMTQGSVIEVATWRGVGRPDSRTSRLMLGVGSGNVDEDPSVPEASSATPPRKVKPQGWKIVLYYLAIAVDKVSAINWKRALIAPKSLASKIKLPKKSGSESSAAPEATQSIAPESSSKPLSTVDADVEAWLNKISEKASKRSAIAAKPEKSPAKKTVTVKKAAQKSPSSKSKRK